MTRSSVCIILMASASFAADQTASAPQALLGRYCVACHNDKLITAGVSLSSATNDVSHQASLFEKVLRKVRTGEMPPTGMPAPEAAARGEFAAWLEGQLDRTAKANPNPGAPTIHRLNRAEYTNAIRDLLGLDLASSADLPPDNSGYGFDNIGDVLSTSPMHMEKYMSMARRVSRLAVGTVKATPAVEKFTATRNSATESADELPLSERGGMVVHHYFPLDAEYSLLVRVRGNLSPDLPQPMLDLRLDSRRVKLMDVSISTAETAQDSRNYEVRMPLRAGMHTFGAAFLNESEKPEGGVVPPRRPGAAPPPAATQASVEYLQIGGPFNATGPGETESRKRIFVCRPAASAAEEPCARKILSNLAQRAYRRPVTQTDIAPLVKFFAAGRTDGGSFDTGIETALRAMLVSPDFLFRVERDPAPSAPASMHRVGDLELASRLSFFLWSSIPDAELLQLAERGELRNPSVLNQQVRRMLADEKSKSLVENFAGQWLAIRNLIGWQPDPDKYPNFDDGLRDALRRETELFFNYIVHEDRSVLDFLDADYTFLNDRLARHYGISGVRGSYFRRVSLSGDERGGILTQGSVLTVTSYPTRTSPVLRGKWVLENVLGAPPPPPPPVVPTLSDSAGNSPHNLRQQLEQHRANSGCASCHSRIDPLGFALENYDAIGKYRAREGGEDIDSTGSLPNGTVVHGAGGLKKVMLERKDQFVECLAEKLLTYALGRGLEYYDQPAVREMRRQAAANDYRFSSLVLAAVNSVPFQMRRTPER